jgi:AcrR family transcriptional regulator
MARRRRSDGDRSRKAILAAAAEMASVNGLEGLSIGGLAERLGMSKSGLFAHFGSKEELELATVDAAGEIYEREVVAPARRAPEGVARLVALCEAFLSHVERKVFPGGCFFAAAAAEFDARTGPVRDRIARFQRAFYDLIVAQVRDAQRRGELDPELDSEQVGFEVNALLLLANNSFVMSGSVDGLQRARSGIESILLRSAREKA